MAAQEARKQLRSKYRQDHPEYEKKQAGPMSLGDILKNFGKPQ
jgi:hypothetical protein